MASSAENDDAVHAKNSAHGGRNPAGNREPSRDGPSEPQIKASNQERDPRPERDENRR